MTVMTMMTKLTILMMISMTILMTVMTKMTKITKLTILVMILMTSLMTKRPEFEMHSNLKLTMTVKKITKLTRRQREEMKERERREKGRLIILTKYDFLQQIRAQIILLSFFNFRILRGKQEYILTKGIFSNVRHSYFQLHYVDCYKSAPR